MKYYSHTTGKNFPIREGYWKGKECQLDYLVKKSIYSDSYKVYCYQSGKYHTLENEEQKRNFVNNHIFVKPLEEIFENYIKGGDYYD